MNFVVRRFSSSTQRWRAPSRRHRISSCICNRFWHNSKTNSQSRVGCGGYAEQRQRKNENREYFKSHLAVLGLTCWNFKNFPSQYKPAGFCIRKEEWLHTSSLRRRAVQETKLYLVLSLQYDYYLYQLYLVL